MTVTKEQAVLAGLHHTIFHDKEGRRWRSNGICKTWGDLKRKRHFKLPIKRGVPGISAEEDNGFGYITHDNRSEFHLPGTANCKSCQADLVTVGASKTPLHVDSLVASDVVSHATGEHNLNTLLPGWDEEA